MKIFTPEEVKLRDKVSKRRHYLKVKDTPEYKAKKAAAAKALYHAKLKHDPKTVEKINKRNLKNYHEKVRPFVEKMEARRKRVQGYQAKRRVAHQEVKIKFQQLLGGKCVSCGITDHRLLDFDHIDPMTKTMMLSQEWHRPYKELLVEVEKCQLLCPNCHRLKTLEKRECDFRMRDYRNKSRESSFS